MGEIDTIYIKAVKNPFQWHIPSKPKIYILPSPQASWRKHFSSHLYYLISQFLYYSACEDNDRDCAYWSQQGHCEGGQYQDYMKTNCRKSCQLCKIRPKTEATTMPVTLSTQQPSTEATEIPQSKQPPIPSSKSFIILQEYNPPQATVWYNVLAKGNHSPVVGDSLKTPFLVHCHLTVGLA